VAKVADITTLLLHALTKCFSTISAVIFITELAEPQAGTRGILSYSEPRLKTTDLLTGHLVRRKTDEVFFVLILVFVR